MECRLLKRMGILMLITSLILVLLTTTTTTEALWISIPTSDTKCVSEEIHSNVVVLADYYVISADDFTQANISLKVTSPYGNTLYNAQNVSSGQFAFTTHEAGNYLACFWSEDKNQSRDLSINLDWKTGIAAKDWDSVAKKEKIEGVELELKKLEEVVQAIHENLLYLKTREREMRSVSETTNTRVALCSLLSLTVCLAVSALQILYLKRYFRKKKLI